MSEERYLILHKVSGEPAFDIAHRLETDEEIWIVSTSGHRAYPYQTWCLEELIRESRTPIINKEVPEDWPDHYQNVRHDGPSERATFNIGALLSGLIPKVQRRF